MNEAPSFYGGDNSYLRSKRLKLPAVDNAIEDYPSKDDFVDPDVPTGNYPTQTTTGEDRINIAMLPDEILIKIFTNLPLLSLNQVALVCRRWSCLSTDLTLWNGKSLDLRKKILKSGKLNFMLARGIKRLNLSQAWVCSPAMYRHIVGSFPLRFLDLSNSGISEPDLLFLLGHCDYLVGLNLDDMTLTARIVQMIGKRHPRLEAFSLKRGTIVGESIITIIRGCPRLQSLTLEGLRVLYASWKTFVAVLPPAMIQLGLPLGYHICGTIDFPPGVIEALVIRCPLLKSLDLAGPFKLSEQSITSICQLKNLETLDLADCLEIPNNALSKLLRLPKLTSLAVLCPPPDSPNMAIVRELNNPCLEPQAQ